ncbi:MAG: AraC family transcriptional regulator [Acidobacteria bacterium]|nr:AraC family transcriptional regulator [Acidobacteriota bacterium]
MRTGTLSIDDVLCSGECRHKSAEEQAPSTQLAFPYRGVFVRHARGEDAVAEANQVIFINRLEPYCVSHPVEGGDASLVLTVAEPFLAELIPKDHLRSHAPLAFNKQRLRVDARTQALVALLRHSLNSSAAETLEAETLGLTLVRRAMGEKTSHIAQGSVGHQKLVDRAKLVLSSDLERRWNLADIAAEVRVSPVYLTAVFQQVEGMPLYRYQLRLRLARALSLLSQYDDLTALGADLGFSSHSHFSAAFKQAYGRTPAEFQRSVDLR